MGRRSGDVGFVYLLFYQNGTEVFERFVVWILTDGRIDFIHFLFERCKYLGGM